MWHAHSFHVRFNFFMNITAINRGKLGQNISSTPWSVFTIRFISSIDFKHLVSRNNFNYFQINLNRKLIFINDILWVKGVAITQISVVNRKWIPREHSFKYFSVRLKLFCLPQSLNTYHSSSEAVYRIHSSTSPLVNTTHSFFKSFVSLFVCPTNTTSHSEWFHRDRLGYWIAFSCSLAYDVCKFFEMSSIFNL